jgi:predicted amidohydrolase
VYDAFGTQESRWVRPGPLEQPPTFLMDALRFGLQSCYDLRFPEVTRRLADAGADVTLVPAEWVPGPRKRQHWRTLLRARAIENTKFVVGAGQTAPGGIGNSMVIDPSGKTLAQAENEPGLACAALSASVLREVRRINPSLSLRRYSVMPATPESARNEAGAHPVKFIPE